MVEAVRRPSEGDRRRRWPRVSQLGVLSGFEPQGRDVSTDPCPRTGLGTCNPPTSLSRCPRARKGREKLVEGFGCPLQSPAHTLGMPFAFPPPWAPFFHGATNLQRDLRCLAALGPRGASPNTQKQARHSSGSAVLAKAKQSRRRFSWVPAAGRTPCLWVRCTWAHSSPPRAGAAQCFPPERNGDIKST